MTCADQLDGIQQGAGKDFRAKAKLELGAQRDFEAMQSSLKDKNLRDAQKSYDKIPQNSVYLDDAKKVMTDKKQALINEGIKIAKSKAHRCEDYEKFITQQNGQYGDEISSAISAAVKCEPTVVVAPTVLDCSTTLQNGKDPKCKQQFCAGHEDAPQCTTAVAPPPVQNCQALVDAGTTANAQSDNVNALKDFEKAYACKPDAHVLSLTFMAACNAQRLDRARYWWKKLSSDEQTHDVIICVRANITRAQLDATGP